MESWQWAVLLRPLAAIIVFAAIIIPIEMVAWRLFPDSRLKDVLFDRTFRDRRPWLFMLWWFVLVGGMIAALSTYLYFFGHPQAY